MHRDAYTQASGDLAGPVPGDDLEVQTVDIGRRIGDGAVWTVVGEAYPDGSVPVWTATLLRVAKAVVRGDDFRLVDEVSFDKLAGERERSVPRVVHGGRWNLLVTAGNRVVALDQPRREVIVLEDADPGDPDSAMERTARRVLPDEVSGEPVSFNVTFDGHLVLLTTEGCLAALTLAELSVVATTCVERLADDEFLTHNQFPVDDTGGVHIVSTHGMRRLQWNGSTLEPSWVVRYDTRGDGFNGRLGSGTTPTLLGASPDDDRLVVVVDAATPNNLVAFWRDEIPADWEGLPGRDRRIAAVTPLPAATPEANGWSVENSPVASGYDVAVAQYQGLTPGVLPPCRSAPGVQRLRWDPEANAFEVVWVNDDIGINGVLTLSTRTGLLYGSAVVGCRFVYYGLDWATGRAVLEEPLGRGATWSDGGNQQTLPGDGSLIYGGARGWVRLAPRPR
jgi:hypothetical protein